MCVCIYAQSESVCACAHGLYKQFLQDTYETCCLGFKFEGLGLKGLCCVGMETCCPGFDV